MLLSVNNLSLERGDRFLFSGFSLDISCGELVHLKGGNGTGKTSLMRVLAGLLEPETMNCSWQGQTLSSAHHYANQVLYLGHSTALKPNLTALENCQWLGALHPKKDTEITDQIYLNALAEVGLAHFAHQPCSHLSAGQQKRVALARLSFSAAKLWMLDEPLVSLDADSTDNLSHKINDFVISGGSVIFSSHLDIDFGSSKVRAIALPDSDEQLL